LFFYYNFPTTHNLILRFFRVIRLSWFFRPCNGE
jgi:hypothetical protein